MAFLDFLHLAADHSNLSAEQALEAMSLILEGQATTAQIAAFLVALRMKGETSDEIYGFARAMRDKSVRVDPGPSGCPMVDTCGTGGDGSGTFNISTVVAFVVAGTGVKVAKHGNRSVSSQCGSADILEALGTRITVTPQQMGECIRDIGIGFLFAPALHPAMRYAQPARLELKMRTAFNLLGPLTNPAGAEYQLIGAPSDRAAELMANALARLEVERAFVVHGSDGLDEITTTGPSLLYEVCRGSATPRTVTPDDFGLPISRIEDFKVSGREESAAVIRQILKGGPGPARNIVLANSAAALVACGAAPDFRTAVELAAQSIDSRSALGKLESLARYTQSLPVA